MRLSSDFYFYILSVMLLAASFFHSRSVNPYQIIIHLLSLVFIYLTIFKVSDKNKDKDKIKSADCGINKNKTVAQCLQNQCHKATTSDECKKYARCQWNNNTCMTKQILCENLDKTACNTNDCQWNNGQNRCFWKQRAPDDEYDALYDAENHGLNAKCFKSSKPPDLNNVSLNDFVNDSKYTRCINACATADETCINKCKLDSAKRSKCEAANGFKYNMITKTCDKFYSMAEIDAQKTEIDAQKAKIEAHDHNMKIDGYKRAQSFQMNRDHLLVYFFKSLLLLITILVNINVIILLKNYTNPTKS